MRARELQCRLPRPWRCPSRTVFWRLTCVHLKFSFAKVASVRFTENLDARPRRRFPCDEGRRGTLLRFSWNCQQKFQRFPAWVCETASGFDRFLRTLFLRLPLPILNFFFENIW